MNSNDQYDQIELLVERLEGHLASGDAEGLLGDLASLEPCSIFSGNDLHRRLQAVRVDVVLKLFRALPWSRFLADLTLSSYVLTGPQVLQALEKVAAELDPEQVMGAAERFDSFPREGKTPRLRALLLDSPEEVVSRWLVSLVEDDRMCEEALGLLGERGDPAALEGLERLLLSSRWSESDWRAVEAVRSLSARRAPERCELVQSALTHYQNPSRLRRALLEAYKLYEPERAVECAVEDLLKVENDQEREDYLRWLPELCAGVAAGPEVPGRMAEASLAGWSTGQRRLFWEWWEEWLPGREGPSRRPLDRLTSGLVKLFQAARLSDRGCVFSIPVIFGLCYLYILLLNLSLGRPPGGAVDAVVVTAWVVTAALTARRGSGAEEGAANLQLMSIAFFSTALLLIVAPVAMRL